MGGTLNRSDADAWLPARVADGSGWGRTGLVLFGPVVTDGSKVRCGSTAAGSGFGDSSKVAAGTSLDVGTSVMVGGAMVAGCLGVAKAGLRGRFPLSSIGDCGLAGRIIAGVVGAEVPMFGAGK
jgi:hypothetical protein